MGKTRAEIQRNYRERKKLKEGDTYLQRERERTKKYYTPIVERSKKDVKARREKVRTWVQKHRKNKKKATNIENLDNEPTTNLKVTSDENQISSTTNAQSLIVKMPFFAASCDKGKARTRKRISRATAKQRREIKKMTEQNKNLQRKYNTMYKRFQRAKGNMKLQTTDKNRKSTPSSTPRKRTIHELQRVGVSPSKIPKAIMKKLLLSNVINDEIRTARKVNGNQGKALINRVVSGKIVKKYRMKRALGKEIGVDRKSLSSTEKSCLFRKRRRLLDFQRHVDSKVVEFLARDDNSRQLPGKNDVKKTDGEMKQRRVLNDSLNNLYLKFVSENPEIKISRATFCRRRPRNFCLTKYISKNSCLCQKHQNIAFLLKAVKADGVNVPLNPEEYARKLEETTPNDFLAQLPPSKTTYIYEQWKRVDCQDGKKRMKVVSNEANKEEFCEMFSKQSCEFLEHVQRIKSQYKAINDLKANLPLNHVIVQMDFSENFSCSSADEIQSAYWNACMVTLHPVVTYYKMPSGQLGHRSYVFVSDDLGHNAGSVYAFLLELIPLIQKDIGIVTWVHYWTDSPSSQYRNKTIFYIVSNHKELLGVPATWNYFEAGHGKGPCDGIGGTAKRMADLAVRQRKCQIQDATDFYQWGQKYQTGIKYILVKSSSIASVRTQLDAMSSSIIPLKGTMKMHAIAPVSEGVVRSRVTSCYCDKCLKCEYHADWMESNIRKAESNLQLNTSASASSELSSDICASGSILPHQTPATILEESNTGTTGTMDVSTLDRSNARAVGDYVAVVYQGQWYIGRIEDVDTNDGEIFVTFMQKSTTKTTSYYKWPKKADELWVSPDDILCKIQEPVPYGRSGRNFHMNASDEAKITGIFADV